MTTWNGSIKNLLNMYLFIHLLARHHLEFSLKEKLRHKEIEELLMWEESTLSKMSGEAFTLLTLGVSWIWNRTLLTTISLIPESVKTLLTLIILTRCRLSKRENILKWDLDTTDFMSIKQFNKSTFLSKNKLHKTKFEQILELIINLK